MSPPLDPPAKPPPQPPQQRPESPQAALQHYFDEMLAEGAARPVLSEIEAEAEAQRQKLQKLLHSARPTVTPPVSQTQTPEQQPVPQVAEASQPEPQQEEAIDLLVQEAALEGLEWMDNGLPAWAQKRFDVLLFNVSGLTLAVPLIALGQIQPLTDELTPLFGQADWFMGLLPTPGGKIRTVNTAKFVMPERYDENFVKTARYVISINGVPWGLAVDSVNQPIALNPEDVKWRSERTKRPWLAGTVKEHMCALLDIPRIGQLLMDADRNSRRIGGDN